MITMVLNHVSKSWDDPPGRDWNIDIDPKISADFFLKEVFLIDL